MQLTDIKKLRRFKNIVSILAKYGFDEIVERLDVPGADFLDEKGLIDTNLTLFERIRIVLEELGPTFVKFGQIMSIRPDLLPPELLLELEKLQDNAGEVDLETIVPAVEESLDAPLDTVFSEFEMAPVASASLSQVHRAVLREDGTSVAVKVQRPEIVDDIITDLNILESVCLFLDQQFENVRIYNLPELADTIRNSLMKELDFRKELNNINVARSYAEQTGVHIPEPLEKYSSKKLLVMKFFNGVKFKGFQNAPHQKRAFIARQGLQTVLRQILKDGFFHADPHPGNLLVNHDLELCLIDWGMTGRLTEQDRFTLIDLLIAVVDRNSEALSRIFQQLAPSKGKSIDTDALERELLGVLDSYYALPIKEIDIGSLFGNLLNLLREHNLQLPQDMVIMIKALVTAEGSARLVFPELNVIEEIQGQVQHLARERYKPGVILKNMKNSFMQIMAVKRDLPQQLLKIIEKIEAGELSFTFQLDKLEHLVKTLEHASNRLTTGIITGAIIMGSSMIITTGIGPFIFGLPALGVIGYLLSVVLGLWLVVTILRSRNY